MTKLKHKVNMPSVTEDEALELMIHHLSLAAAYYERPHQAIMKITGKK